MSGTSDRISAERVIKSAGIPNERKEEYPDGSLQPALSDQPELMLGGSPPLRAMLVSADKVHVLQIQHDRFFMNWRAIGGAYPRFSNRAGGGGLLEKAVNEYARFGEFCSKRFGRVPAITRVELAKIDVLERARHWSDAADLAQLVPVTGVIDESSSGSAKRDFLLRLVERNDTTLVVSVNSVSHQETGEAVALRIETRAVRSVATGEQVEAAFVSANTEINRAFFRLISKQGQARFGIKGG